MIGSRNTPVPYAAGVPYGPGGQPVVFAAPPTAAPPEHDGLDFGQIFEAARRRYGVFLLVFVIVFGLALALTLQQKPRYTATAKVMVDPQQAQLLQLNNQAQEGSSAAQLSAEAVATQVELLQSRIMAERVVDALHLDQDPSLWNQKLGLRGRLMASVSGLLGAKHGPTMLTPEERRSLVIDATMNKVTATRLGLTYIINVDVIDPSPVRAAKIANAYATLYVAQGLESKTTATRQAGGFLNDRLQDLSSRAGADAAAVQQYKVAHNLLGSENETLTQQEISNLNQQIASARAEAASDQARLNTAREQLRHGSNGGDVGAALSSPVITTLRAQRAQASAQLAELNARYGPRYVDVQKAEQQLADIDAQIHAEINRLISNLQAAADVSRGRLESLESTLAHAHGTLASDTRSQAGLTELQQKASASQTLYDDYLARFKEIMTSAGAEQSDARVVALAETPDMPSSPKIVLDLALGVILASMLGAAAGVVAELVDQTYANGPDIERRLHAPYLGSVPLLTSVARPKGQSPAEYLVSNPFSVFAEAFRNLKVATLHASGSAGPVVVAVTSPLTGEGKTTTAVCLGEASGLQGVRTVIVDCDLRRRTLQRFVVEKPQVGLVEVITGRANLESAIVVDAKTGVHYLPLSQDDLTAKDVFGGPAMDELLAELRLRYDFIILDTAPLLALAEARSLAAKCDAVVLLCRWRKTSHDALSSALRLLRAVDAPIAGVALTRVDVRKQRAHGYGDSTYYYREAGQYYVS